MKRKILRASAILGLFGAALFLVLVGSFLVSAASTSTQTAASGNGVVIIANFNYPVDPGSAAMMSRVVSTAKGDNAAAIVIEMNTPGGTLSDMTSIINSITDANESGIPTYTYIEHNGLGASAGSYIAMATNKILMGPGAEIGPSTLPGPLVAEPERRQDVQLGRFRAAIWMLIWIRISSGSLFGILNEDVKVAILVEHAGIQQFILKFLTAPTTAGIDQVSVRVSRLRILVEVLHVRMGWRTIEVEVILFDVLAVIAFAVGQPKQPFFEDRIVAVP